MIRAACLRALALVLLAMLSGGSNRAQAEQPEPAGTPRQADAPAKPAAPSVNAPGQNPASPAATPASASQPQTTPAPTTPAQTPAAPTTPAQTPGKAAPQTPGGATGQNPAPGTTPPQPTPTGGTGAPLVTPYPPPGKTPAPAAALIPNDPIMTPAQQVYGVPRNPVLGGPVDFDLTRPLSLDRAIRIGLLRQNTIAVALAQTDVARAGLTQARASYYPQVSPSFQFQANVIPGRRTIVGSSTSTTTGGTGTTITGPTGTATNGGTSGSTGVTASASAIKRGRGTRADSGTGTTTGTDGTNTGTGSGLTPGQSSGGSGTSTGTGGTTTTGGGSTTTTFINGSTSSDTRTEVVAAQLNLYDSGRREANVGFARRNVFAAEYGLGNQRQNVILTVTEDYYNLLRTRELVRVQQENVRRAQTTLEAIQAQVQAGAAAQSDTLQAQSDLANAQINLLSSQNDVRIAEAALKNAMGVVATPSLVLADTQIPAPNPTPDAVPLDNYVQTAYTNRLDLKQQQEIVNAQGYNVRIAHINNGVTLNASISEGYQLNPDAGEERSFVVSVGYPLFDGGTTRAGVRSSKAALETDRRDLDALQQNVRLDIEQQYYTRELARQRVQAANVAVQAGQLNYQAALEKQRNGLVNILEVLNAQVQLITAQVSQVQAIYDFYIADARLFRDIGQNDANFVPDIPGNRAPKRQYTRKP